MKVGEKCKGRQTREKTVTKKSGKRRENFKFEKVSKTINKEQATGRKSLVTGKTRFVVGEMLPPPKRLSRVESLAQENHKGPA